MRLAGRLARLWNRSRIRLPKRPLAPEDLAREDRIGIGGGVWRIRGRLLLVSGSWAFLLEPVSGQPEGTPTARLLAPAGRPGPWTLIRGGWRVDLPAECLVVYPAGLEERTQRTART